MTAARILSAQLGLLVFALLWLVVFSPHSAQSAPYAALVIDARSGEVLHARNADTRLHPASLTKMMTLYVAFEAVERGEISLDTQVTLSKHAVSEPYATLGMRAGSKISLRHLIRAAAVKSSNDAATAIGEAISGSEVAFTRRMNRTAKALGMTKTTFKNAHGLTQNGHMSTARDMTILGRHVLYDYPEYYHLFSRRTTMVAGRQLPNTNRRLLNAYKGADGIKTGFTNAAGFNLVASAERGNERIIATVFGGKSSHWRNQRVAELLDMGFQRAPSRATLIKPRRPAYVGNLASDGSQNGRTIRVSGAVKRSIRPQPRPLADVDEAVAIAMADLLAEAPDLGPAPDELGQTQAPSELLAGEISDSAPVTPVELAALSARTALASPSRPKARDLTLRRAPKQVPRTEIVAAPNRSAPQDWGVHVGSYPSRFKAEQVLLATALTEMSTLDGSRRAVVRRPRGFDANFLGLSKDSAERACRRLQARNVSCSLVEPGRG